MATQPLGAFFVSFMLTWSGRRLLFLTYVGREIGMMGRERDAEEVDPGGGVATAVVGLLTGRRRTRREERKRSQAAGSLAVGSGRCWRAICAGFLGGARSRSLPFCVRTRD